MSSPQYLAAVQEEDERLGGILDESQDDASRSDKSYPDTSLEDLEPLRADAGPLVQTVTMKPVDFSLEFPPPVPTHPDNDTPTTDMSVESVHGPAPGRAIIVSETDSSTEQPGRDVQEYEVAQRIYDSYADDRQYLHGPSEEEDREERG